MQVKVSEDAANEFKELMTLMKDSTDPTEEETAAETDAQ